MEMTGNFTFNGDFSTVAVAAVLSVEIILALIANGIVLLITITQRKSWKQSSTVFFTSLILAHLVLNVLYIPFTIIAFVAGEWIFGSTDEEKKAFCEFNAYILWYSILNIILMLAAISFDRFLFIVKPHLHKQFMRPWVALTLTIAIWLLAALLSSTPLYGLGEFGYDTAFGGCLPLWTTRNSTGFIVYTIIVCLSIIIVISITSIWTFCFTRSFLSDLTKLPDSDIYVSKKKRLFGIFGAMSLLHLLCFTPGIISAFLTPITLVPYEITALVIISFEFLTIASPLVQSYFRPDIQDVLLGLCIRVKFHCGKKSQTANNSDVGHDTEATMTSV